MACVQFTPQLRRFVEVAAFDTPAQTLRAALDEVFAAYPMARGYVLDDQSHLRANVVIYIDGRRCHERVLLQDALLPESQIYILQALSGG